MDLSPEALSPTESPLFGGAHFLPHAQPRPSFPITAVAVIGILATAFLLVGYYIFVIKCCLNWHRIDLLTRFSASRGRTEENPPTDFPPAAAAESRWLDEAAIGSIPVLTFKKENFAALHGNYSSECAVCLNDFREGEKMRAIPRCCHVFHVDCIDVWLQSSDNCPLCRASVWGNPPTSPSLQESNYVVIEMGFPPPSSSGTAGNSSAGEFPARKTKSVLSMGDDEWIEMKRARDAAAQLPVIRRSFSMDSTVDSQLYEAVRDIIRRRGDEMVVDVGEGCSSGDGYGNKMKKSLFSFGQGKSCLRNAVQPVASEPL